MPRDLKDVFEFGHFRLDAEDGSLRRGDELVRLPRRAADVLMLLVEEPGAVRSRKDLMSQVWDVDVEPANLDYQIHLIRQALGKDPDGNELIETVPRRGFRFTGTVRRLRRRNDRITDVPATPAPTETTGSRMAPVAPALPATAEPTARRAAARPPEVEARTPRRWTAIAVAAALVGIASLAAMTAVSSRPSESLRVVESRALAHDQIPGFDPLLTDGARVYYLPSGTTDYRSVAITGGASDEVFGRASGLRLADVDRGGSGNLAIRTDGGPEGGLWIVPPGSGRPRRVGKLTASEATWSPDGSRIALISRRQLRLADRDGANVVAVEGLPRGNPVQYPRWSPDGSIVRFTVLTPNKGVEADAAIWEVRSDGTHLRPALREWGGRARVLCGAWSPDGRHYVFETVRSEGRSDLWAQAEPSGLEAWVGRRTAPTALTAGPISFACPAMSPDGRTMFAVGALRQGELVRWDRATRAFVPYLGGLSATWVAFSPDRQWVAYVGYPDRKLWRSRLDGSEPLALVGGDFELDGVAWSPDGRTIVFRSRLAGRHMKNFLIPSTGGKPGAITEEDRDQGIATWSPDGSLLVFGDVPPRRSPEDDHFCSDRVDHPQNAAWRAPRPQAFTPSPCRGREPQGVVGVAKRNPRSSTPKACASPPSVGHFWRANPVNFSIAPKMCRPNSACRMAAKCCTCTTSGVRRSLPCRAAPGSGRRAGLPMGGTSPR